MAESKKREVLLEAKEEIHKSRMELDRKSKTEEMRFKDRKEDLFKRKKL